MDYVVGLHENTNELRIMRFTYDSSLEIATIKDYKVVDKDPNLIL